MEKSKTQICILGGGNGAHFSACVIGSKENYIVNLLTRRPKEWKNVITGTTKGSAWEHIPLITGKIQIVSDDPEVVSKGTKIFLICAPANVHEILLRKVEPFIEKDAFIGTLFAQGGFDWMCHHVLGEKFISLNLTIFGLYTIPSICQKTIYGQSMRVIGPKTMLYSVTEPQSRKGVICEHLHGMYGIPCSPLPNFLSLTLIPSNQIIHPGRVYGVLKDWDFKTPLPKGSLPQLYDGLDDFSADQIQLLDNEI